MKILHTSDLHFGVWLCGQSLIDYQKKLASLICETAKEQKVDAIIIAGDVYDRANPSVETVKLFDDFVTMLFKSCKDMPIIITCGNHDNASRLAVHNSIVEQCGIHIRCDMKDYLRPIAVGDTEIYCLPYFSTTDIEILARENGDITDDKDCSCEIKSQTSAYSYVVDKIKSLWDSSKNHILVAHCFTTHATTSDSEQTTNKSKAFVGGEERVDVNVFEGFDYVALGHLHKAQDFSAGKNTIVRYSGTPLPYSFSEGDRYSCEKDTLKINKKSFSIYDTVEKSVIETPVESGLKLNTIEGSFDEMKLYAKKHPMDENEYIKLFFTDRSSLVGIRDEITELFPRYISHDFKVKKSITAMGSGAIISNYEEKSVEELTKMFIEDIHHENFTDEMALWIKEAVESVENKASESDKKRKG